jgi:hypothetical protein
MDAIEWVKAEANGKIEETFSPQRIFNLGS